MAREKTVANAFDVEKVSHKERLELAQEKLRKALQTAAVNWTRRLTNEVHGYDLTSVSHTGDTITLRVGDLRFIITVQGLDR